MAKSPSRLAIAAAGASGSVKGPPRSQQAKNPASSAASSPKVTGSADRPRATRRTMTVVATPARKKTGMARILITAPC